MDSYYPNNFRRKFPAPDDLVRMDRAVIYLRGRVIEIIEHLKLKNTKTVGDHVFQIWDFAREMESLTRMAGEVLFIAHANDIASMGERTIRVRAIARLQDLLHELESYEAVPKLEEMSLLRDRRQEVTTTARSVGEENVVFVIMPFHAEFNDVWNGGIKRACMELNLTPVRVDMINKSTNITDDIVESINSCRIAIADVTNNNPNVMFELGYAVAKSKPNIIISQSSDFLPFDIRHLRTIVYMNSWSGIENLKVKLKQFLQETHKKNVVARKKAAKKGGSESKQS